MQILQKLKNQRKKKPRLSAKFTAKIIAQLGASQRVKITTKINYEHTMSIDS
jgi:hypothetical protein